MANLDLSSVLNMLNESANLPQSSTPDPAHEQAVAGTPLSGILGFLSRMDPKTAAELLTVVLPLVISMFHHDQAPTTAPTPAAPPVAPIPHDGPTSDDIPIPAPPAPPKDARTLDHYTLALGAAWRPDHHELDSSELSAFLAGGGEILGGWLRFNVDSQPQGLSGDQVDYYLIWHVLWHDSNHPDKEIHLRFAYHPDGTPVTGPEFGDQGMPIGLGQNQYNKTRGWNAMFRTGLYEGNHVLSFYVTDTDENPKTQSAPVTLHLHGK